jgi:hypothetical protein
MKTKLTLALSLIPAFAFSASGAPERADGVLGTDFVSVSALYSNVDMGHYQSGLDLDYFGIGARANKHIGVQGGVGMDASVMISGRTNQNNTETYTLDQNDYEVLLTFYDANDGVFAPYFSAIAGYQTLNFKNKRYNFKEDSDNFFYGGEAGVEIHLLRGFSFIPYVDYLLSTDSDYGSQTSVGGMFNYWFTNRIGANFEMNYANNDHVDNLNFAAGVFWHF